MRKPNAFEADLGRFVRARLGASTKVVRFADDDESNDVFIVSGTDCPCEGVTSYGTVGLSQRPQRSGDVPVSVELLAACSTATKFIDNLAASCVFDSTKNRTNICYGAYIENILRQYGVSRTLEHVTFVAPFLWDGFDRADVGGKTIHWLLTLPISASELAFLKSNGIAALEKLFEQAQIDVYDINRKSVV